MRLAHGLLVSAMAFFVAPFAWAGPPPAKVTATVFTYGVPATTVGGVGSKTATLDGITASVGLLPTPSATVSGIGPQNVDVYFLAAVQTYIQFKNAAVGSVVPVDVFYTASVTQPEQIPCPIYCVYTPYAADVNTTVGWGYDSSGTMIEADCGWGLGGTGCPVGQQKLTLQVTVEPGDYVTISAGGVAGWTGGTSAVSASIDPFLEIDPAWAATHSGVSLQISPDVGNGGGTPAPEPATWALFTLGLALAGGALRARASRAITA